MNALKERLAGLEVSLREEQEQLENRIGSLEKGAEDSVLSYSVEFQSIDLQKRTARFHMAITTDRDIREESPRLVINGIGTPGKFNWTDTAFSSGPDGKGYSVNFELPDPADSAAGSDLGIKK